MKDNFCTNYFAMNFDQKQPPRFVPRKRCFENMQQIYRRTPMPKLDFNTFKTPFLKSISRWLLLFDVCGGVREVNIET